MDLEVWISGTPAQVEIALHGLRQVATFHHVSRELKLVGNDAGRVQRYIRAVPAARKAELPSKKKEKTFTDEPLYEGDQ